MGTSAFEQAPLKEDKSDLLPPNLGRDHCKEHPDDKTCALLTPDQRTELIALARGRLHEASSEYGDAITEVRVAELLKEPDDIPMLTDLVIDAISVFGGNLAKNAIKLIRSKPVATISSLGLGIGTGHEQLDLVKGADDGLVSQAVTGVLSASKKGAKKIAAEDDGEFKRDQDAATAFLDSLRDLKRQIFDALPHVPPMLDNPNLVLFYHAWSPTKRGAADLRTEIENKLTKFRSSPASKIGRRIAKEHVEKPTGKGGPFEQAEKIRKDIASKGIDDLDDIRDTKLVLHHVDDESPPKLYYYRRDYLPMHRMNEVLGGPDALDPKTNLDRVATGDWTLYKEVEPEFAEAAMAANAQVWGVKYEAKDTEQKVEYSTQPTKPIAPRHAPLRKDLVDEAKATDEAAKRQATAAAAAAAIGGTSATGATAP